MTRAVLCLLAFLGLPSFAQQPVLSPRDSAALMFDSGSEISVNYGRPSLRGRTIMGGLLPWGKIWRTGANLATHLRTTFDMRLGGMPVPRGVYTLYSIPGPARWTIIVNNQTGQWGTQYDPRQDRARISVTPQVLPAPVDTFRISLVPAGRSAGILRLAWERTLLVLPFERDDRIRPVSPPDSVSISLSGRTITIRYSRPYIRGREIWGTLVPLDSVWRTGANAATALVTDGPVRIGGKVIPRGTYSLFSIPAESGLTLLVNRKTPGPEPEYVPALDIARIPMRMTRLSAPIDPFRIRLLPSTSTSCALQIGWADRLFSVPVTTR
jgi:hypothetical protein